MSTSQSIALVVSALLLLLALAFFASCKGKSAAAAHYAPLLMLETSYQRAPDGQRTVSGFIVNRTTEDYPLVKLNLRLFDAEGAQLGTTIVPIGRVEPGARIPFSVPVNADAEGFAAGSIQTF